MAKLKFKKGDLVYTRLGDLCSVEKTNVDSVGFTINPGPFYKIRGAGREYIRSEGNLQLATDSQIIDYLSSYFTTIDIGDGIILSELNEDCVYLFNRKNYETIYLNRNNLKQIIKNLNIL